MCDILSQCFRIASPPRYDTRRPHSPICAIRRRPLLRLPAQGRTAHAPRQTTGDGRRAVPTAERASEHNDPASPANKPASKSACQQASTHARRYRGQAFAVAAARAHTKCSTTEGGAEYTPVPPGSPPPPPPVPASGRHARAHAGLNPPPPRPPPSPLLPATALPISPTSPAPVAAPHTPSNRRIDCIHTLRHSHAHARTHLRTHAPHAPHTHTLTRPHPRQTPHPPPSHRSHRQSSQRPGRETAKNRGHCQDAGSTAQANWKLCQHREAEERESVWRVKRAQADAERDIQKVASSPGTQPLPTPELLLTGCLPNAAGSEGLKGSRLD
ncbi:hypothetical protein DFH27DRAFT_598253 [Peziza echinospora]|nr:hypothetical protein DFH27DRAFT_598253 [Peziza echinospora]